MSVRKIAKRACDGCKIRKIKCSEAAPCEGCAAAGIACTFVRRPASRGPRKLRRSTLQEIQGTQQQWEQLALPPSDGPVVHTQLDEENVFAPAKIAALVLQLCVYRLRTYPIWPVIKVERLVASLQKPQPDIEVFALAYAVAAATIARIKPRQSDQHGGVTAEMMEAQCQYARAKRPAGIPPDLTTVRIPFFLHVYHEELEPGGLQSITSLREAITIAHMMGLHREAYYQGVQPEEQEIRRRTMWLLFVTERSISIKHKLPVIIKMKIRFPSTIDTDEHEVLLAYQKLITMFWRFDESGVFEMLDEYGFDISQVPARQGVDEGIVSLRRQLDESHVEMQSLNNVQALDIVVTRLWMRILLWRLAASHGFFPHDYEDDTQPSNDPICIAQDLLEVVVKAEKAAIEAHGPALETKIFEIASTVADACSIAAGDSPLPSERQQQARAVLAQMKDLLSNNRHLSNMLQNKIAQTPLPQNNSLWGDTMFQDGVTATLVDPSIETQLQADGFHFTELPDSAMMDFGESDSYDVSPPSIPQLAWTQHVESVGYTGFVSQPSHDPNHQAYA